MLSAGVIERTNSDCCSPAVLVQKKDRTVRFCTNYQKLNMTTDPLSQIAKTLKDFEHAKIVLAIDLKSPKHLTSPLVGTT